MSQLRHLASALGKSRFRCHRCGLAMTRSNTGRHPGSKRARAEERRRKAKRKKTLVVGGASVAIAAVLVLGFFAFSSSEPAAGVTETEAWDLPALGGEGRVALADFRGKPTVAAFFASWCTICRAELPGFGELSTQVGDKVNFVGINTMNRGTGLSFAREMGIGHWPLARDVGLHDGRGLATNFGARGSPTTVIYDAEGRVVDVTLGGMTAAQLGGKLTSFFGISIS